MSSRFFPWLFPVLLMSSASGQWSADSAPTRTTSDHGKRVIGYVTQWDAWKTTDAGQPKQGFLNHLNLDYTQYTHLNFSFFGVAHDGSLHSGDYRNKSIYQAGAIQDPAPLFHGDIYSSWDYYLLWGELSPQWNFTTDVLAAGFVSEGGGWRHTPTGLTGPMPVPYKPPGNAPGILELAHSKGVKVMASTGGWSMCRHFPEMAADPVKRARFVADCQKLITLGFDGIDFDWEYPGPFSGMNFTGSGVDFANFLTLITELRAAIGPDKEITSAMSASPAKLAGFDWPAVSAILDSINLMTYDFEGGWSDHAGHNAALFPVPGQEATTFACATTVEYLSGLGVPRSKLSLGIPFYGRGVICDGPAALGAPTVKVAKTIQPDGPIITAADFPSWEPFDATPTYQRITQLMSDGWTRHWDDVSKVPYLTKGNSFLSYDDSHSVGEKAAYVRQQDLGGVIVWTAFGDLRAGALSPATSKLPFSPATDAPLINVVNSVLAGDAVPADGTEGPAPASGPSHGLNTLPARPLVVGYVNGLRDANGNNQVIADYPTALAEANLEAFDVLIAAFVKPNADGTVTTDLGATAQLLPAVVAEGHQLGKSVVCSVGGAFPAELAVSFAAIAASPQLRQDFADNLVAFLETHDLDGVDIDYEFPANAGAARSDFTSLMQTIHATVKAADPRYIVMFGSGPGWYLGGFDFDTLGDHCDFFFYFGYDWKNPHNGPLTKPGSTQWTNANDQLPEASVKGGVDYVIGKGFPADKIIVGLPFYGSNNQSWSSVRDLWAADPAAYPLDPASKESQIGGAWFTTPPGLKAKMDGLLDPGTSVLSGSETVRGVGCWEIGHEHASHPDLSTAFAEWIAGAAAGPPTVSIAPATTPEGNTGTTSLNFLVTLSHQADVAVNVDFATGDGTAVAPGDYSALGDTLVIPPGDTSGTVAIEIVGELAVEADETFTVTLSNPVNATLGTAVATGTVVNDDSNGPGPDEGWTNHSPPPVISLTMEVVDDWGSGFQGRLHMTNLSGSDLETWSIQFDAPWSVSSMSNGIHGGQAGPTHTVSNPGWAGVLADGATAVVDFIGAGTPSDPGALRLDGQPVGAGGQAYSDWAAGHGLAADSQMLDPNHNRHVNLMEYLYGNDPLSAAGEIQLGEIRELDVSGVTAPYFCTVVPISTDASEAEYRVITADNPAFLPSHLMVLHALVDFGAGRRQAIWRSLAPITGQPTGFARVEVRMRGGP